MTGANNYKFVTFEGYLRYWLATPSPGGIDWYYHGPSQRRLNEARSGKAALLMLLCDGVGQIVERFEVFFSRKPLASHRSQHFRLKERDHCRELFHSLAAPAIGANNGDELEPGP
jgi:hypothetical protein